MERAVDLWAEVLTLSNLHEVSSRLFSTLPMAASAFACDGNVWDAKRPKRKYSERRCGEQDTDGVNELLLKHSRHLECEESRSLAGKAR